MTRNRDLERLSRQKARIWLMNVSYLKFQDKKFWLGLVEFDSSSLWAGCEILACDGIKGLCHHALLKTSLVDYYLWWKLPPHPPSHSLFPSPFVCVYTCTRVSVFVCGLCVYGVYMYGSGLHTHVLIYMSGKDIAVLFCYSTCRDRLSRCTWS